jgi:uncharacterized protein (DUF2336 family)
MNSQDRNLQFLLELALDKSVEGRESLAQRIGELFSEREEVLTEQESALLAEILGKLVLDIEMSVRQSLAERLAESPLAPHDLVVTLANDQIEVARPILIKSAVLRDRELIAIIRHRGHQHQLAIAMRTSIDEIVSDALVETGQTDVIKRLLENHNAKISETTLSYLTDQSQRVDSFHEPLLNRHDLTPDLAQRMYWWVSAALREQILKSFDIQPGLLDDSLEQTVLSMMDEDKKADEGDTAAVALAKQLVEDREVTPEFLISVLRRGEIPLFEALFGEVSRFKPPELQRVLYHQGGEGLAIICRSLGYPKQAFATIFLLSRRGRPGSETTDPRELSRAVLIFDKVSRENATLVANTWRRNPNYRTAIEQINSASNQQQGSIR